MLMNSRATMYYFIWYTTLFFAAVVSANETFIDNWLEMPMDHFNLFDNSTWKMRYLINDEFFRPGGPIFIEVNGEWTMTDKALKSGQLYKLASQHHGLLMGTEHRYYGKGWTIKTEITIEYFKYLTIEMALEDIACFIEKFKESDSKYQNSKVVLHGCSYPGILVTLMRLKFPHLVDIAYASSAPLGLKFDDPGYHEVVNDVYANVSADCIKTIREGFNSTLQLIKTAEGLQTVRTAFKNCGPCGISQRTSGFNILRKMIQALNVQNIANKFEDVSCLALSIDTDDTDAFHRLANFIILKSEDEIRKRDEDEVFDSKAVQLFFKNTAGWIYHTCTQIGSFQTLNATDPRNPFQIDNEIDTFMKPCIDLFGTRMSEQTLRTGIERVRRRYGGEIPVVTKVVTVQGAHDPWSSIASMVDYNEEAPVLVAQGSHCVDIQEDVHDPEDILAVKAKAREWVTKWLSEVP